MYYNININLKIYYDKIYYMLNLIFELNKIINYENNYTNSEQSYLIKKCLSEYNIDELIKICDEYINKKNIIGNKIEINNNYYTKFILTDTTIYSLILIKWNKDVSSKIHDHPDNGCIVRLLKGELKEECYKSYNNILTHLYDSNVTKGNFSYKEGKKVLHKIIAISESISLHVYVPGLYKLNIYD
jgi:hypothetical protein